MLKKLLLLVSLVFVLFSCEKEEQLPPELCVWPVGEFYDKVYLYDRGEIYGDPGVGYCIDRSFISFYAEPFIEVDGVMYEFKKWCYPTDAWNGPTSSRYSNPIQLGKYGPMTFYHELEIEPIYNEVGTPFDNGGCVRTDGGLNGE